MIALGATFVCLAAQAGVKETKALKGWTESAKSADASFQTSCGYALTMNLDSKFTTSEFMKENANAGSYCKAVISGLSGKCSDADFKKAVQEKVKKASCVPGAGNAQTLELKSGTLVYTVGPKASNQDEFINKWLEANL